MRRALQPTLPALPVLAGLALVTPALATTARAQPVETLEGAIDVLKRAAEAEAPARSRELARRALPFLRDRMERPAVSCAEMFFLAEAELRAGEATRVAPVLRAARQAGCDEVAVLHLEAWSLEHDAHGVRRGPDAPLKKAERKYLEVVDVLSSRPGGDRARIAQALGSAADLALLRGDVEAARERAESALRRSPPAAQRRALGLTFLAAASARFGEGASLDRLSEHLSRDELTQVADARLVLLRERLDRGHDDPVALAAVAFYALLTGDRTQALYAQRYLQEAIAIDDDLPDLWYLLGRAREATGDVQAAKDAYLRQRTEHPGTAPTRLAVNALGHLTAQVPRDEAEVKKALELLDEELGRSLAAPMLDTRARLLLELGRTGEACTTARHGLSQARGRADAEVRTELESLIADHCSG